ncbi:MAG: saccharopine dehydrogenase NADP-binding domain-containing protein [Acidobacteriia bacterium]|nr:saccharopine dehydrogenase NADP-binding domain-containing protein [Terriglobia bacterium]
MNRSATFGVIGGSGSTAKAVAKELRRSTDKPILIGGRNLANAEAVAANLGVAVSAVRVDIRDARSLEDFCGRSSIVVNCGGPVCELQDLVAQATLRTRSHYVDVAGLTFVREGMMPHHQEVADRGLSCVVSAGWLPGMSELLPAYSLALAKTGMDAVQSVTIHFGDSGEWSNNALRDAAWYLRKFGRRRPRYMHDGEWVRARLSEVLVEKDIGSPMGRCLFSMSCLPEMAELMSRFKDCDVRAYSYLPSRRTAIAGSLIALLPMPVDLAVRILRPALHGQSLPVGGFNVVEIQGRCGSREVAHRHRLTFERDREYWINAVVAATVARLISDGRGVKPGVHFLVDAVDPIAFIEELRRAGVTDTQSFSAQVSTNGSSSARPAGRHRAFLRRTPSFNATTCN